MSDTSGTDAAANRTGDNRTGLLRRGLRPFGAVLAVVSLVAGVMTVDSVAAAAATSTNVTVTGAQYYGTSTPAFNGVASGGYGVNQTITCTKVTTGATINAALPAGSYTIDPTSCSGVTFANPNIVLGSYVGGTFTVSKSPLTLTASNQTKVYGSANPTLTYTLTGFLNGDTQASATTGAPLLATSATTSTGVGSYAIQIAVNSLKAANYTFTIVNGTLTITPIVVGVKVSGAQFYGGSPAFSATTSVPGVTAAGVTCTTVNGETPIASTLIFGGYSLDPSSCTGAVLNTSVASPDPNYAVGSYTAAAAPSFSVYKAGLTVSADPQSRIFGTANPTLTYEVTGFVNGETAAVLNGSPSVTTSATTTSDVGSYPISISQGTLSDSNYSFSFVGNTLSVTPASTTVTVTGAQNYGSSAVGFAGASSVNGVTISGVTCTTVNGGTPISSTLPAGTYTIDGGSCSGGVTSTGDYAIGSYTGGTFTVYKVALTFQADNQQRIFGAANPTLTYTVTGFVNGDTSSVITGTPGLSTNASTSSNVGNYVIGIGGSVSAANYRIVFVNGTLTVNPAPLVVTVTGAENYGATTYGISGTVTVSGSSSTVPGVVCTTVNGGTTIDGTLNFGGYTIDGSSCSGGTLSNTNYAIGSYSGSTFNVYKAPLTVTANNASKTYGAANPSFSVTFSGFVNGDTSSVLSGAPSFSTTATTSSTVGTYPITPGAGSLKATNYYFQFVSGTLTVNQYAVVVTVTGAQNYGSSAMGFSAKTSVSGITATGASCTTVNGGTPLNSGTPAGGYTLDSSSCSGATLSDPNFVIGSYTGSAYTIYRVALTATANAATKVYGAANPTFSASYSGFVNGDTSAVVSGSATFATTATASSATGTYPITIGAGTLHASNYYFALANGTLTVTPAQLTVTANNATRVYGSANPTFSAAYTGFVNGDTASVVGGSPAITTSATTTSDVGSYAITPALGTLTATNYTFGFVNGTLTITQATPSITATTTLDTYVSATLTYGASATPVVGQTVTFTMNTLGTALCTAVTDSTGLAKCTPASSQHLNVILYGYVATFAGSLDFAPVNLVEK
jgi:hypothetical protein